MKDKGRINILDVLRVIAVIMVMISHYYLNYPDIGEALSWGAFGVPLFFIISGFVINASLEKTHSYKDFIIKRFVRLSPAMLICSTITFLFFRFIYTGEDYLHSKKLANYLIANTFIDPTVFNVFWGKVEFYYIDNAYWSLWVEICFYTLIGLFYFINKKKFILYYTIFCFILTPLFMLIYTSYGHYVLNSFFTISKEQAYFLKLLGRSLAFFDGCFWFLIGLYLYQLYKNSSNKKYISYILFYFFIILAKEKFDLSLLIFSIIVFIFLMIFIYKPQILESISHPIVCKIGVASYSMYLIHYHLGMVAVKFLQENIMYSYFWPFLIAIFVISFGLFSYNYLEKPLSNFYKKLLDSNH